MNESPIKIKSIVLTIIISQLILLVSFIAVYFNNSTQIVFCDVGQGDGIYIRIKNRFDIIIDAGPDNRIVNCLGKYMPFYDHEIELAILTHPQLDHYGGFLSLVDRYRINNFATINIESKSQRFQLLKKKLSDKKVPFSYPVSGDVMNILGDELVFYWPINKMVSQSNMNDDVLIFMFKEVDFKALFTADASYQTLNSLKIKNKVDLLKVPHHGSKNGLNKSFLQLADPHVAVISVGKNNSYGHPHQETLGSLKTKKIEIKRTDKDGDVVFKLPNRSN